MEITSYQAEILSFDDKTLKGRLKLSTPIPREVDFELTSSKISSKFKSAVGKGVVLVAGYEEKAGLLELGAIDLDFDNSKKL